MAVKFESKSAKPTGGGRVLVMGIKLATDKGTVWKIPENYDQVSSATVVTDEASQPGWGLIGCYGAETRLYLSRVGAIWAK